MGKRILKPHLIACFLDTSGAYSTMKNNKEDKASLRPPSYTDRILCHSQPDARHRLRIRKYDMCDSITASDHRPVAAAIDLEVSDSVYMDESSSLPATATFDEQVFQSLPETIRLLKIRIFDLQVHWYESDKTEPRSMVSGLISSLSNAPHSLSRTRSAEATNISLGGTDNCIIYFPLQNEDPIYSFRRSVLMNHALSVGSSQESKFLAARNLSSIHSFRVNQRRFDEDILEFRSLVCSDTAR